jgi:hypothetical protein
MKPILRLALVGVVLALFAASTYAASDSLVTTIRLPDSGVQPQALADAKGRIHLIYFMGDPAHGDAFYVCSDDDGKTFSKPIRVNSQPGSVIAIGTVRGPHLALGRNDRVHVAWMGSSSAEPKLGGNQPPMLYTRLSEKGDAFEPQRNVIHDYPGLNGGGSIAADRNGNVYVAWHAPDVLGAGEADRHVWVARSSDDGNSFAPETDFTPGDLGACGCCGMKAFTSDRGDLFMLYRSASQTIHRDIFLVGSHDSGKTLTSTKLAPWEASVCVMSTASMCSTPDGGAEAAVEQQGNIVLFDIPPGQLAPKRSLPMPGTDRNRKHPSIAANHDGQTLVAWSEGTGWARGGRIVWQTFDENQQPMQKSAVDGLPVWDAPAVVATHDGHFLLFY